MRRSAPKQKEKEEKEKPSPKMGNQPAKPAAANADAKPAAAPKEVTPGQLSDALQKVMSHSLQNKPGTPEYELKLANDKLVALQAPITALEGEVAKASPSDTEKLEKQAVLHEEALMKVLLQLDMVQGEAYREQRKATVKAVQVWQQRIDAVKKTLSDRKAAM